MPFDPTQSTDKNTQGFSIPLENCVGDAGPSPAEVTTIAGKGSGPLSGYEPQSVPVGYDGP